MRKVIIALAIVFVLIFTLVLFAPNARATAPEPGTTKVGCVLYPNEPYGYYRAVGGIGEQLCFPDLYIQQRVRVALEEKKVIRFWPDEWHTKRYVTWSYWTTLTHKRRSAIVECDTLRYHWWRVRVEGQFVDAETGIRRNGMDHSQPAYMACHVKADQTTPTS